MGHVACAFSVHNCVNSVGADAGFASSIGLAVLVLLYFAQARETATLREQLEECAERVEQLEGRLARAGRQAPAPGPQPTMPPAAVGATSAARTAAATAGAGGAPIA